MFGYKGAPVNHILVGRTAAFLVAAGLFAQVSAQELYAELGFESLSVPSASETETIGNEILTTSTASFRVGGVHGRLGWDFTPHFGLEAQAVIGVADTDVALTVLASTGDSVTVDMPVKLNYAAGVFARGQYPISDRVALYGRLGGIYHKFTVAESRPEENSGSDTSPAAGAGATFKVADSSHIRLDFTRFCSEGEDVDSLSLAFGLLF